MRNLGGLGVVCVLSLAACSAGETTAPHDATEAGQPDVLYERLVNDGPARFARVTPNLYRGGQPDDADLASLAAMGVKTIVNLRGEALGERREEWTRARALGMDYVEFPFFGVLGVDRRFVEPLLRELERDDGAGVYIHCNRGRDRTSLIVAIYRVCAQGWTPQRAWEEEVVAYGHESTFYHREIALSFHDIVEEHHRNVGPDDAPIATR